MSDITLKIQSRTGRDMGSYNLPASDTVETLKKMISKKNRISADRIWLTVGDDENRKVLKSGKLSEFSLSNNAIVVFKDLGRQISWRTVFLIEYFGPILTHTLCYAFPNIIYGQPVKHHLFQTIGFWLVIIHYVKREFETIFIHRFSNATMPIFNLFKNSFHYWVLCGINISYFLYHPQYTPVISEQTAYICALLFIVFELGNLFSHIILRNLRAEGTGERGIPYGLLFNRVSCGNYTFELLAWLCFALLTQVATAYVFLFVSTGQIALWAKKKHEQYEKDFGTKYTKLGRKILFPYIW